MSIEGDDQSSQIEESQNQMMSIEVRPNLILFWLRTKLDVNTKGVTGIVPNTILGVIPVGSKNISFPTRQISGIQVNTKFSVLSLLFGLLFTFSVDSSGGGLIRGLLGILLLANAYTAEIVILNTGNGQEKVKVTWLDKPILEMYANKVRAIIHAI